jgi:hypothetical protein
MCFTPVPACRQLSITWSALPHPRLIGQAARIAGLKDFLDYALDKGDVWFAKCIDIAH